MGSGPAPRQHLVELYEDTPALAERRTEQRMRELLAVTAELAAAVDEETVGRLGVETGRAAVGAHSAVMWMTSPDGTAIELIAASESSALDAQRYGRVPLEIETPATYVLRTGEPLFLTSPEDYDAKFPVSFARIVGFGDAATFRAMAILPMRAGSVSGVIVYSYRNDHVFEESGRAFKTLLARQCGKNNDVVFYVRDTGPGIDAEELPNLFERHWRSKSITYKGAGLGLSIARGIVDAHGGKIWAESRIGAGSTFYFSLSPGN
jgi:hypothetical protein